MNRPQQEQARAKLKAALLPLPKLYQYIFILKFAPDRKDDSILDIIETLGFDKLERATAYIEKK